MQAHWLWSQEIDALHKEGGAQKLEAKIAIGEKLQEVKTRLKTEGRYREWLHEYSPLDRGTAELCLYAYQNRDALREREKAATKKEAVERLRLALARGASIKPTTTVGHGTASPREENNGGAGLTDYQIKKTVDNFLDEHERDSREAVSIRENLRRGGMETYRDYYRWLKEEGEKFVKAGLIVGAC